MRILPLSGIVTALSTSFFTGPTSPGDCFTLSTTHTLEDLIKCFDGFTVPANGYTATTYAAAQPTLDERNAWMRTVGSMLSVDSNCLSVDRTGIANDYTVRLFTELVPGGKNFCVLSESRTISPGGHYRRGWGLVVVPVQRSAIKRNIHFSAPHPKTDSDTPWQAAALFKLTGARSLVITGRRRDAFQGRSCQGTQYFTTDASHDIVCNHIICTLVWDPDDLPSSPARTLSPRDESGPDLAKEQGWMPERVVRFYPDARQGRRYLPV